MASVAPGEHFDMSFIHDEVLEMTDVSEVDGALLLELLDEFSQPDEAEICTASVAHYMEAETGPNCSPPTRGLQDSIHPHDGYCEDCGLDDILSDLNCYDCARSSPTSPALLLVEEDLFVWNEAAASLPSGNMGEWYMDDCMHGCGMMCFGHGDLDGYSSLCMHVDNSMDEDYSSLWE